MRTIPSPQVSDRCTACLSLKFELSVQFIYTSQHVNLPCCLSCLVCQIVIARNSALDQRIRPLQLHRRQHVAKEETGQFATFTGTSQNGEGAFSLVR